MDKSTNNNLTSLATNPLAISNPTPSSPSIEMDPNNLKAHPTPGGPPRTTPSYKGPTTCGSPPSPIKGLQVFIDSCLICNNQSYLCPKDNQNETSRQRTIELRSAFYSLFEIPVPDSFIRNYGEEIPFCSGCTFKLGRLKTLYEQLEGIQKEFGRMKEEIAFNIVDVVASSGEAGGWGPVDLRNLPNLTLQRYLKQAEVDTLQRFVFDEWHDKSSTDEPTSGIQHVVSKPPVTQNSGRPKTMNTANSMGRPPVASSGSMQPPPALRKVVSRPVVPGGPPGGLTSRLKSPMLSINRSPGAMNTASKVNPPNRSDLRSPQQKTTVISITTPEGRIAKKAGEGNHLTPTNSTVSEVGKRKSDIPAGTGNVTKKLKSIPGINEARVDLKGAAETSTKKVDRTEGVASSPVKVEEDSSSSTNRLEISLDEGEDQTEEWDPTDIEITKVRGGDSGEMDGSPENGRPESRSDSLRESSASPGKITEEIDFYEGMSLSELASYVAEEDPDLTDGQEVSEEVDPERQKYLENIIAQLQAGGSNIEFQQNEEGLYVCMFCSKTFIHKYPYRDHLKTHTGEGPRCPVCNKIFPKNHNLMLHLRTHTGEKPFQCDVCHKGFADKSNLKVHYRVHTGEKPYKCDFCNLAFVNSSRLVVHRRLHTGERPFACEYCGKTFATPNQLQSHEKVHKAAGTSSD